MNILLTGADGQLGRLIHHALGDQQALTCTTRDGDPAQARCRALDLERTASIQALLDQVNPELIINAAAFTAVDQAESMPERAQAINATAVGQMARWCADHGARLVQYSTDYVFDGHADRPYLESDAPNPASVYGQSKLEAEQQILASGCQALIFRTAWVYANVGKNFLNTMLALATEHDELRVVDDQFGLPTWAGSLATLSLAATRQWIESPAARPHAARLYHLSAGGTPISWCQFAQAIFEQACSLALLEQAPRVQAIGTAEYPTAAVRPVQSALCNDRFEQEFDMIVPHWRDQLDQCLSQRSTH